MADDAVDYSGTSDPDSESVTVPGGPLHWQAPSSSRPMAAGSCILRMGLASFTGMRMPLRTIAGKELSIAFFVGRDSQRGPLTVTRARGGTSASTEAQWQAGTLSFRVKLKRNGVEPSHGPDTTPGAQLSASVAYRASLYDPLANEGNSNLNESKT